MCKLRTYLDLLALETTAIRPAVALHAKLANLLRVLIQPLVFRGRRRLATDTASLLVGVLLAYPHWTPIVAFPTAVGVPLAYDTSPII